MLGDAEPVRLTDWVGNQQARDESNVVMVLSTPVEKGYDDGSDNNSDDDEQGS